MPRKPLPGPSNLSVILKGLNQTPRPFLAPLKSLNVTLAAKNDHFGARHFIKEELPRIQYANPNLAISVKKVVKTIRDVLRPEMTLEFHDGGMHTFDLSQKWSTTIFEELMDLAGGEKWEKHKLERAQAGELPLTPEISLLASHSNVSPTLSRRPGIGSALP